MCVFFHLMLAGRQPFGVMRWYSIKFTKSHSDSRHFRESQVTDGEPETAVSACLQKIKSIKNHNFSFFYLIKSQTSDTFVNNFDGHFAYLKILDFSFKNETDRLCSEQSFPKECS